MEIYVYCSDIRWPYYEAIQADIFDHILSIVPQFGLRVFQQPSGADMTQALKGGSSGGFGGGFTAARVPPMAGVTEASAVGAHADEGRGARE